MLKEWKDVKDLKGVYLVQICSIQFDLNDMVNSYYYVCDTLEEATAKYDVFVNDRFSRVRILNHN